MGQSDVVAFLRKHRGKKYTVRQIAESLKQTKNSVSMATRKATGWWGVRKEPRRQNLGNLYWYDKDFKRGDL